MLSGEIPDPTDVPSGCRFHPRCPVARDSCSREDQALRVVNSSAHQAACIHVGGGD
jgi:oligopeptide/dipeptide ABC transporter ATP-binding protein